MSNMVPSRDQLMASSSDDEASLAGLPDLPRNDEFDAMFGIDAGQSSDSFNIHNEAQPGETTDFSELPERRQVVWTELTTRNATQLGRPASSARGIPHFRDDSTSISNHNPWAYSVSNNHALAAGSMVMPGQGTQPASRPGSAADWAADVPIYSPLQVP